MGKKGGGNEAAQARSDEQARQQKIREGTSRVNGIIDTQFTPDYFVKQRQNFIDYANPQLEGQLGDARKELTFSLARGGNLNSSARADLESELQKRYDLNKQQIQDQALSYETSARNNVEDARANLIATLNATGDAEGASNAALARATALSQPVAYSPLTQLFADFTAGLGTQAAAERSYAAGGSAPTYSTGLFGTPRNAVTVR